MPSDMIFCMYLFVLLVKVQTNCIRGSNRWNIRYQHKEIQSFTCVYTHTHTHTHTILTKIIISFKIFAGSDDELPHFVISLMSAETFSSLTNPGFLALNLNFWLSAKQTVLYFQGYRILTCPVSNMSQSKIFILMVVIPLIFSQVKFNCPFNIITDSIFYILLYITIFKV